MQSQYRALHYCASRGKNETQVMMKLSKYSSSSAVRYGDEELFSSLELKDGVTRPSLLP